MKEVVFENGKLVLQKRKISQMEELFLIASKEHDKKRKRIGFFRERLFHPQRFFVC